MSPGAGADAAGGSPPLGGGRNSASSEGRAHRLSPCSSKGPDAAPEGCALLTSSPSPPKDHLRVPSHRVRGHQCPVHGTEALQTTGS